jgi:hypothetical protein
MNVYMYYVSQHRGISFDYSFLLVWVAFYFTQDIQISLLIYALTSGLLKVAHLIILIIIIILLLFLLEIPCCLRQILIYLKVRHIDIESQLNARVQSFPLNTRKLCRAE